MSPAEPASPDASAVHPPSRREPTVRAIVGAWRRLTGGRSVRDDARRTLVACSGGADSSALLLALATVNPRPEVCHVVHDLRARDEAAHEADRVEGLCGALGVRYHRVEVACAGLPGNAEANARAARYEALARVACERGLRLIATGHHADDQLETVLMRLLRGAGAKGMAGIRPTRALAGGLTVVRPMLGVTHADAIALCDASGWRWNSDPTNGDTDRLRAALRARVLPALREVEPEAARRVTRSVSALASASDAVEAWAASVLDLAIETDSVIRIETQKLVELPIAVRIALVMQIYSRIVGVRGRDRLSQRLLSTCTGGILAAGSASRSFEVAEMRVSVCSGVVEFRKK
jgi:tRNA(Ile)-lysidine synthase